MSCRTLRLLRFSAVHTSLPRFPDSLTDMVVGSNAGYLGWQVQLQVLIRPYVDYSCRPGATKPSPSPRCASTAVPRKARCLNPAKELLAWRLEVFQLNK